MIPVLTCGMCVATFAAMNDADRLYSVAEVMAVTGLSRATITKRHRVRNIGRKVGPVIVFTHSELAVMAKWPYSVGRPLAKTEA